MERKEIGGYFSLELSSGVEYHNNAIRLSNARAAFQYILRTKKYRKIYLPHYICGCVLQPILAENVEYEYYPINEIFEPVLHNEIQDDECILYVNYFGINNAMAHKVSNKYDNVIIDSTQAFYSEPEEDIDTFYSARKFFGVSDGAYLYTDIMLEETIEKDISYNRMEHLLRRLDLSASEGYEAFHQSECTLNNAGIKEMSNITQKILSSVDYERCAKQRVENYQYLHEHLGDMNQLHLKDLGTQVPMIYPFYCDNEGLRDTLIANKIYVATYWPDVMEHVENDSLEASLTKNLLALPIDQRYGVEDMEIILSHLL